MITSTMSRPARIDLGALLDTRPDRYEEARDWVASLDVNIGDVTPQIAIVAGEHGYLLHLTRYLRDEQGRRRLDVAADRPVTEPIVIDLGASPTWPAWLVSEEWPGTIAVPKTRGMNGSHAYLVARERAAEEGVMVGRYLGLQETPVFDGTIPCFVYETVRAPS